MKKQLGLMALATALCVGLTIPALAQDKQDNEATRDLNPAQRSLLGVIKSLWKGHNDEISVKVTADHRLYHFGDAIKLRVEADKDAYVILIDQGASGRTHYLLPNKWHQHQFHIKAHTPVTIPPDNGDWTITAGGPRGAEMIYAIASSKPFSRTHERHILAEIKSGQNFPEEKKPTRAVFRDLVVSKGKVERGTTNLKVYVAP
jgi:hypothetical protein